MALFSSSLVSTIRIDLIHGAAAPADTAQYASGTMTIRINQTQLEVDQTDGITWSVSDPQEMVFRPGNSTIGEDPDHWFLLEWRDIPSSLAPQGVPAVEEATWGLLKARCE